MNNPGLNETIRSSSTNLFINFGNDLYWTVNIFLVFATAFMLHANHSTKMIDLVPNSYICLITWLEAVPRTENQLHRDYNTEKSFGF